MSKTLSLVIFWLALLPVQAQRGAHREWKLAVQMWTFNKVSFVEALEKADSCGFKYIEAFPGQPMGGSFTGSMGPELSVSDRKALKALLKKKGITLLAYGAVDGTDDAKTDQAWRDAFDFAKDMGIAEITAMPTAAQLDLVNSLAGSYQIRVGLHDEPGSGPYSRPDSVARAIQNRPNLGACVDVGNWVRNGVNVVDAIKNTLKGRVVAVHLKDVQQAGVPRSPEVVLGQGACNIAGVMQELKQQGFTGFFSIEHPGRGSMNLETIKQDQAFFYSELKKL